MKYYIIKRLLFLIPMIFIVTFIVFLLTASSGEHQALVLLKAQGLELVSDELIAKTVKDYGFDRPVVIRYFEWLGNAFLMNFGTSYVTKRPVSDVVLNAFGYTLQLGLISVVVSITFSLALGILCAIWEGRPFDLVTRIIMFILSSLPAYLMGILLMWFFSVHLRILPTSGVGTFQHFIMPVFALAASYIGFYSRVVRTNMLESKNEKYTVFLKSCGISKGSIIRHELKNSLQTLVTAFTMAIIGMIAGTFVVENIFSWPGLGRLCITSIFSNDIPIIQAYVLIMTVFYCVFNIAADIVNAAINPRLRGE